MISRRAVALALPLAMLARGARAADQDFAQWLQGVRQEAMAQGIRAATLDTALANVAPLPHVIELDRRQPETTLTFDEYIERVVTPQRREAAQAHFDENRALLGEIGERYGVAPAVIVALWGIETDFGRVTGDYPVIAALATLAFDGRRPTFFRHELLSALTIVDREHIDPHRLVGSWAGAMGQSQFMPSSFLNYAVSYRGTAAPDIWTRRDDVFASIANFLARSGWRPDESWGNAVSLPPGVAPGGSAQGPLKPPADWAAIGIRRVDGKTLPKGGSAAALIAPDGAGGPVFLVYDNFRVLLKWNNSSYFAVAVGYLADSIDWR